MMEPEQAFQFHQGLRDLTESVIKYLAIIVLAKYRQDTKMLGREQEKVEKVLQKLRQPALGHWTNLLRDTLGLYSDTSDPLLRDIYNFYYEKTHKDTLVSEAIIKVQEWLRLEPRRKPPFQYLDFFELLVPYRNQPEGWAAHGAMLADREYKERVNVLRPALEQGLVDLEFLADYPLVYVQEVKQQLDGRWSHRLYPGIGRNVDMPQTQTSQKRLETEHLYLCREGPDEALDAFLDVYPLIACQECPGCNQRRMSILNLGRGERLEYLSYSCGHSIELKEEPHRMKDFFDFLDLERWRNREASAMYLPYANALHEILVDGAIDSVERQQLDFLAKMLKIPKNVTERLEVQALKELRAKAQEKIEPPNVQIRDGDSGSSETLGVDESGAEESEQVQTQPVGEEQVDTGQAVDETLPDAGTEGEESLPQFDQTESNPTPEQDSVSEINQSVSQTPELTEPVESPEQPQPEITNQAPGESLAGNAESKKLVLCWAEPVSSPVLQVALFDSPLLALVADERGHVCVYSDDRRVIYRDRIEGRLLRVATLVDRVLIGTWEGSLYCFGNKELLWQMNIRSPISAIAVSQGAVEIVAGSWDGRILALGANGNRLWENKLDDGISSLAIAQAGDAIVAGSYAGHLAFFDSNGKKMWLRDRQAAVMRTVFTSHGRDIIVATQDRLLSQISVDNQEVLWEQSVALSPLDFGLSSNNRRLIVATKEGNVLLCSVNGGMSVQEQYEIPELAQVMISPLSRDGYLILCWSRFDGLLFWDTRKMIWTMETKGPVSCLAMSPDGRYILVGDTEKAALFRLVQPDLRAVLKPVHDLVEGRFSRLRITLENSGERPAREITMELDGPVNSTPVHLPEELGAGKTVSSEEQSIQPKADGTVPIQIRLKYVDELGILHEKEYLQMLDVSPS